MDADDYAQIHNLLFQYALNVDTGNIEALAAMFADADVLIGDATLHGKEAALQMYSIVLLYPDTGTPKTHHVTTNVMIEPDGPDSARSRSYFTVFQATAKLHLQPIIAGRYQDRLKRVSGRWQFAERRMETTLAGTLTEHLSDLTGI